MSDVQPGDARIQGPADDDWWCCGHPSVCDYGGCKPNPTAVAALTEGDEKA